MEGRLCQFLGSAFDTDDLHWVPLGLGAMRRCPPRKKSNGQKPPCWEGAQTSHVEKLHLDTRSHAARELSEQVTPVSATI